MSHWNAQQHEHNTLPLTFNQAKNLILLEHRFEFCSFLTELFASYSLRSVKHTSFRWRGLNYSLLTTSRSARVFPPQKIRERKVCTVCGTHVGAKLESRMHFTFAEKFSQADFLLGRSEFPAENGARVIHQARYNLPERGKAGKLAARKWTRKATGWIRHRNNLLRQWFSCNSASCWCFVSNLFRLIYYRRFCTFLTINFVQFSFFFSI